jgi:chromosome segregation ATPase
MDGDLTTLWSRVEEVRKKRLSLQGKDMELSNKYKEELAQLTTRCTVAETRVSDLERMLANERAIRSRIISEKTKMEAQLQTERAEADIRIEEAFGRIKQQEQAWKDERRRYRAQFEALKRGIDEQTIKFEQEHVLNRKLNEDYQELERELQEINEERENALSEARVLSAKLEVLEKDVLPKAREDQSKLEALVHRLKADLEETIDSEAAFRTLFLKEQSARKNRRAQNREEMLDLMTRSG